MVEIGYILFRKKDSKIFSIREISFDGEYSIMSNDGEYYKLPSRAIRKYFN